MTTKLAIVRELGEGALLLPEFVNLALEANERVKYLMTLLQVAKEQADHPGRPVDRVDLGDERTRARLDGTLDEIVRAARREPDGACRLPGAAHLHGLLLEGIEAMIAPLRESGSSPDEVAWFEQRLAGLGSAVAGVDETLSSDAIDAVTHARRERGDSLHLLVMDLHKALNRLQADIATETIGGARAHGLREEDRALVAAFMRGLTSTAHLKFDHPGLDCTAVRSGEHLVLQNDIGTTDAHVLVVQVALHVATVHYTDVHAERMRFFQGLCDARVEVDWKTTRVGSARGLGEAGEYLHAVGTHRWSQRAGLERFLEHLGSRLVFLIDWNKARKRLRNFVGKADALAILAWAVENELGHRAFLQLGGERLIFDAIERAGNVHVRYGRRLDEVLGREQAVDFLERVLRMCTRALAEGRSEELVRDQVRAELLECFHTVRQDLFAMASEHAALVVELASAVQEGLLDAPSGGGDDSLARRARRGKRWERRADELVSRTRDAVERTTTPANRIFRRILESADDAADGFEDALFLLTLVPPVGVDARVLDALRRLSTLAVQGSREFVKCLETASLVHRGGSREDVADFLAAANGLIGIEHASDETEREVTSRLLQGTSDARQVHLAARLTGALEDAVDALCLCAALLREHVLGTEITA